MTHARRPLAALALIALAGLAGTGCSDAPSEPRTTGGPTSGSAGAATTADTPRTKAVRFSACMRDNGVAAFPDPGPSGELTIDEVANGSSLDTSTAAFQRAISACKDLQPSGFTGRARNPTQQESALAFARCMRENGVPDFPDPTKDGPLIDTRRIPSAAGRGAKDIPELNAAIRTCTGIYADELGLEGP